jgi:hypothetical protein
MFCIIFECSSLVCGVKCLVSAVDADSSVLC